MALYYMLNKPRGYITSKEDPAGPAVMELFPPELSRRLHPIGRLDKDTEGLLLLTDDGQLDWRILRPERHVPKEYQFYSFGKLGDAEMERLASGVKLPDGDLSLPARAELVGYGTIGDYIDYMPEKRLEHFRKNPQRPVTIGRLWIRQGKKHQVKLMVKAVGGHVFRLIRLSIGDVRLDSSLNPGDYRPLTADELEALHYTPPAE